jgi:hypothetical protein
LREDYVFRVYENRGLGRIFGSRSGSLQDAGKVLHITIFRQAYPSTNIIRVSSSRRIRWAGHVAPKRMMRNACKFKSENLKGRDHLDD